MRGRYFIAVALTIITMAAPAAAQTGRAFGSVLDAAGKPIKGATIQAANREAYPPQLTATTDTKGRFAIIGLRAGVWRFTAEAPGYMSSDGSVPIRSGAVGAPVQFVLIRTPEPIPNALTKDLTTQLGSAQAMRDEGRYDQALSALQSIQTKNPKLTAINLLIGDVYRQKATRETDVAARQALYDRAIAAYSDLLKTDADNDRARLELGATAQAAGNSTAATKAFQEVIATSPGTPAAAEAASHLEQLKAPKN
jgi:tetratricopeptide (TPR) repeat protein